VHDFAIARLSVLRLSARKRGEEGSGKESRVEAGLVHSHMVFALM